MDLPSSYTILEVERAASDLRRGNGVILRGYEGDWLVQADEYVKQGAKATAKTVSGNAHPAVKLLKIAGLLPHAHVTPHSSGDGPYLSVNAESIAAYPAALASSLECVSEARVPLEGAEDARIAAFRPRFGHQEHLAIIIGEPQKQDAPLVRLHSSCITGDILGSLRCDCGNQLRHALAVIGGNGHGAILYLSQEGRGISIANKLRAYSLQDTGMDTVEANEALGFLADEREYAVAAEMLRQLGLSRITLLTNNPAKIKALAACGIEVVRREPAVTEANVHNAHYLNTKASKMGHHLRGRNDELE